MDLDKRIDELLESKRITLLDDVGRQLMRQLAKEVAKDCAQIAKTANITETITVPPGKWISMVIEAAYDL